MTNILDLIIDRITERFASTQTRARRPSFKDIERTPWASVPKTFKAYRDGFYKHTDAERPDEPVNRVQDAPQAMLNWIASKTLIGNSSAEKESELISFPVVNPSTNKLSAGGLRGAISRASQASISAETVRSIQSVGRDLLEKEFKAEQSSEHLENDDEDDDYQTKFTKEEVSYRPEENDGQRCGNCTFFEPPQACRIVEGDIDAAFVCDRWEAQYTGDFLVPVEKSADKAVLENVMIFPIGEFVRDGKARGFTAGQAHEMVKNFEDNVIGRKPPVNSEHLRQFGRIGHVVALRVADDGVRGDLEEVEPGALGKFDFLSPEVRWTWQHPFSGQTYNNVLFGVGATNYPFFLSEMAIHSGTIAWVSGEWEQVIESSIQVVSFSLTDEHERIATGIVLQPDKPDGQGHSISAKEINSTFERFAGGKLDLQHRRDVKPDEAIVIDSWIQEQNELWQLDIDGEMRETLVLAGSWCASVRFGCDLWSEVLDGDITGFSVKGWGCLTSS